MTSPFFATISFIHPDGHYAARFDRSLLGSESWTGFGSSFDDIHNSDRSWGTYMVRAEADAVQEPGTLFLLGGGLLGFAAHRRRQS